MSALCEAFIHRIIGHLHLKPGYVVVVLESDSDLGCSFEALTTPEAGDLFFLATYLPTRFSIQLFPNFSIVLDVL